MRELKFLYSKIDTIEESIYNCFQHSFIIFIFGEILYHWGEDNMSSFLSFLQENMNILIIILGLIIFISIAINAAKLSQQKSRIQDVVNRKNTKVTINKKTMEMHEYEEPEDVGPDTIRNYETDFNKVCSWYYVLEQFIPLFPLFGILGTVSGLITQVTAQNIDEMFNSLNTALTSTWFGLIFAIGLKILVALSSTRIIKDVEIMLDDYDKKFSNAIAQKNISDI